MTSRRTELAIFALALVLRLGWVAVLEWRGRGLIGPDAPSYDALATNLLAGRGLQKQDYTHLFTDGTPSLTVRSFRPPLLPILLAGVYGVFGHHILAARVAVAILGAVTCVVVYHIGRRTFSQRAGILAGLASAVYPKFVYYAGLVTTETLCTLLLAMAVWLLVAAWQGESWWRWPAAGAVLALAALSRSSLLLLPGVAVLWTVIVSGGRQRALKAALLLVVAFAAVMSPWWVRNWAVHGRFVPATTEGGYTFWVTNNPRATGGGHCFWPDPPGGFDGMTEVEIDREFYRRGWRWVRSHPVEFVRLSAAKFVRFWRLWPHASEPAVGMTAAVVAGLTFVPVLLLALWGAAVSLSRWRPLLLLAMIVLYFTGLHMVFMAVTRYRLPLEPYVIVLAAWGALDIWGRLRRTTPAADRP
jgi:4-amino-4-deoxy-L-arabinose transferase-like glycosyltransferase